MYAMLSARENDRLLEVGSGTGALLLRLADSLESAQLHGVDISRQMITISTKRNRKHLKQGKVVLQLGDFDTVAYEPGFFDAIYSVNTVYFWRRPKETVQKISRLLKPGGRVLVGYNDRADMERMPLSKDVFQFYSAEEMKALLAASFAPDAISVMRHQAEGKPCYCAIGVK